MLLAVMVVTPCFAQEVETDGLFSIDGTLWNIFRIEISITEKKPYLSLPEFHSNKIGFYQNKVYTCNENWCSHDQHMAYIDTPVVSIAYYVPPNPFIGYSCVMQPVGVGVVIMRSLYTEGRPPHPTYRVLDYSMGIMFKVENNWIPEETIYTSPDQGEQGTILTDMLIHGRNTTFESNPPVEVSFDPPDGLTISNIVVLSDGVITFDLEIAVDAPVGMKRVIVVYDDGDKVLENDSGFEVLPNSN
jgi:hypothetical protein